MMQSNPDSNRQEIAPAFIEWQGVVAIAIALIVAWPLIGHAGLLNTRGGGDSPFLLQRLHQLSTALIDGHFPVRWMPDANYGYGYPFFNYYAPFSIYVAAFFRLLGLSYVRAIQCAQLSAFFVAAWGMYLLARHLWQNRWSAVLASVAYTTAPFHLVNVYTPNAQRGLARLDYRQQWDIDFLDYLKKLGTIVKLQYMT